MPEYKNGRIYKIVNDVDDMIYIGSTTQNLSNRMTDHRKPYNISKFKNNKFYEHISKIGGWEHCRIELVELYPCNNKEELLQREYYWQNELKTLTSGLNSKASYCDKERRKGQCNRKRKTYYNKNKNRFYCFDCGVGTVSLNSFNHHLNTDIQLRNIGLVYVIDKTHKCKCCAYETNHKRDFNRHLNTISHITNFIQS